MKPTDVFPRVRVSRPALVMSTSTASTTSAASTAVQQVTGDACGKLASHGSLTLSTCRDRQVFVCQSHWCMQRGAGATMVRSTSRIEAPLVIHDPDLTQSWTRGVSSASHRSAARCAHFFSSRLEPVGDWWWKTSPAGRMTGRLQQLFGSISLPPVSMPALLAEALPRSTPSRLQVRVQGVDCLGRCGESSQGSIAPP
jgi:hypothetical protein